jgi:hypothetical protein
MEGFHQNYLVDDRNGALKYALEFHSHDCALKGVYYINVLSTSDEV